MKNYYENEHISANLICPAMINACINSIEKITPPQGCEDEFEDILSSFTTCPVNETLQLISEIINN